MSSLAIILLLGILCSFTTFASPRAKLDSILSLRYKLEPGHTYMWNIVADQFVVGNRAVRVSASFNMEAIDSDDDGRTQVRIRLRSVEGRPGTIAILDSVKAGLFPVGNRRTHKAGVYDAVVDELGRIIMGRYAIDETVAPPQMQMAIGATTQLPAQREGDIPTFAAMLLPAMPSAGEVDRYRLSYDTIITPSSIQRLKVSRGGGTSKEVSQNLYDTLYRRIRVDSVITLATGRTVQFLDISVTRVDPWGFHSLIVTTVERDAGTGLLTKIVERGFHVDDTIETPRYVAVAVLDTELARQTDDGAAVLTPPSLLPGQSR